MHNEPAIGTAGPDALPCCGGEEAQYLPAESHFSYSGKKTISIRKLFLSFFPADPVESFPSTGVVVPITAGKKTALS